MKDKWIQKLERQDRRRLLKEQLVAIKGGGCCVCGYQKCLSALEFHHVDESRKEFSVSQTSNLELAKKEIEHCILLCANCHREAHAGLIPGLIHHFR